MKAARLKSVEFKLYEYLINLRSFYDSLDAEDIIAGIGEYVELVKTRYYKIALIGVFKRGKSSLLNALLGHGVLPADVRPATATVNRVTFSPTEFAEVFFKDGTTREIEIDQLDDYVSKVGEVGRRNAAEIDEVVVGYPSVFCQNYIDIIDTPGLEDDERMTEITLKRIEEIDAAIVVMSALSPCSQSECELIVRLLKSRNIHDIVFAVNFIDCLDGEEDIGRVLKSVEEKVRHYAFQALDDEETIARAHRILDHMRIFGISPKEALAAMRTNDRNLLKKSRFPGFQDELYKIVTSAQTTNMIAKVLAFVRDSIAELEGRYNARMLRLQAETETTERALRGMIRIREQMGAYVDGRLDEISRRCWERIDAFRFRGEHFLPIRSMILDRAARVRSPEDVPAQCAAACRAVDDHLRAQYKAAAADMRAAFLEGVSALKGVALPSPGGKTPAAELYEIVTDAPPPGAYDLAPLRLGGPVREGGLFIALEQAAFAQMSAVADRLDRWLTEMRGDFCRAFKRLDSAYLQEYQLALECAYEERCEAAEFLKMSYRRNRARSDLMFESIRSEMEI
ncbi:MAG: hypothetical protein GX647_09325 [Clostridiales bacterium]|nr:hypothetical protein [Clostridiales bacterium]OPZ70000.1 MAG: Bacterial dynamin-like protein [Firmicutes bacterium ADurb.Bin467]